MSAIVELKILAVKSDRLCFRNTTFFDNMLHMMEKYALDLEAIVKQRTDELFEEKQKSETLLNSMLPRSEGY